MPQPKRILIVGGVAGGASAAARARRLSEDAEIVLIERGPHISFANCGLPYHIGGEIADRDRLLVQTPEAMRKRYGIDVRVRTEAVSIDPQNRTLYVRDLNGGEETAERYDALILSPGAEPVRPNLPGADHEKVFTLRNLEDMDAIKAVIDRDAPGRAVVVGGGYIGLEMAEALRHRKVDVTLVELAEQVFVAADPEMVAPVHQQLEMHGVDLRLGASITSIQDGDDGLRAQLSSGESVACGMAIMAVGVRPEVKLAREAGLEIGPLGGIVVDAHMRTSDDAIYAVGDAIEFDHYISGERAIIPLAGPANRQGRIAADTIFGTPSVYAGTQGTAICKVFDLAIGMTGLSEKALAKAGRPYEKVYVHPASHAGYYPGAHQLSVKLLFDPDDGKVLGAQASGVDGVDKRIDVLAVAIRAGLTVEQLAEQELAYAPPFGSAKDPINYAGFVASNVRSGDGPVCHVSDVLNRDESQVLLDVRTPAEVEAGTIPGARNIPLDELRGRLDELPAGREILAFCQVGLRGYLATRILRAKGFKARNLTGGYKTYKAAVGMLKPDQDGSAEITDDTGEVDAPVPVAETDAVDAEIVKTIDARALQCPGPIMQLKGELEKVDPGKAVDILVSDPGFPEDVKAWCHSTGNRLAALEPADGAFRAVIVRSAAGVARASRSGGGEPDDRAKRKTLICFSGDFDKAMASFIIANGAAAMGSKVTIFFTFWGLNILRRPEPVAVRKNLIERMFGWMMPRGATKLTLSKMNMGGIGAAMIRGIMKKKNVASLSELIDQARRNGVRLVACSMSMDLMGIHREELIEGVETGGVAMYLDQAEQAGVNMFI